MSLSDHARLPYQIKYLRCYLAARNTDSTYQDWVDVTRFVVDSNLGNYTKSIDSNDFDIGYYEESNIQVTFDNAQGDFMQGQSYFSNGIVDRSKIKIVAGYINIQNRVPEFQTTFEGIIDDRGTAIDSDNENASFTVLSYSAIMGRLATDPGAVTNGQDFKTALFNLLNRTEITGLLTVSLDNINPKTNQIVDDANWFSGKQLKESINAILLASNSVIRIKDNTIYISSRVESSTVRFQFFGKGSARPCNIVSLKGFNNGLKRVITKVLINSATAFNSNDELISLYGLQNKAVDIGCIADTETIAAIGEGILNEFQYPKKELELTTDFLGNEVDILDMVTIDNEGFLLDAAPAVYGRAVYGDSEFTRRQGGVRIRPIEGYKVLSVTHSFKDYTTTLKLRSVGNQPYDSNAGYSNPIYGQAVYNLSRYARTAIGGGGGGAG